MAPSSNKMPAGVSADDWNSSIRGIVELTEIKFDITSMPADMQRVYKELAKRFGDHYALHTIFVMRTAIELHRGWHMTLLTQKIMQQLKDHFKLRMSWNLGVFRLVFRFQDGDFELQRKVPYDYDSEYQDIYMRIAVALLDEDITVHEALVFQTDTKLGKHTADSGNFLRDFPGRLILYPAVSSTCAVIFFNGDWTDFWIAALTGLVSGLVDYSLSYLKAGILGDTLVGCSVGVVGGLFYRFGGEDVCLSAIFLGTLYWFFYGTAFVVGILEIIAGELETGVTRFIAVSVKTFVLCLGASFGLLVAGDASQVWLDQEDNCNRINLDDKWWRIPLYLACSAAVLGQYRFPIVRYWRALIVMLVGYEVQFQMFLVFAALHDRDNIDTAISNVFGCAAAVMSACVVAWWVRQLRYHYDGHILSPDENAQYPLFGRIIYRTMSIGVKMADTIGLGRESDRLKERLETKLTKEKREVKDPTHNREKIVLEPRDENLLLELIIDSQDLNVWSILMPALYQLVPGSLIAKLWFNYIFPPPLIEDTTSIPIAGEEFVLTTYTIDEAANNVFSGLMIISTSLALGLIFGFAAVQVFEFIFESMNCFQDKEKMSRGSLQRAKSRMSGMYSAEPTVNDDPDSVAEEFRKALLEGPITTANDANRIFDSIDVDQSGTIERTEACSYMLKAGLDQSQVDALFLAMDANGDGVICREEFRNCILDKSISQEALMPKKELDEAPAVDNEENVTIKNICTGDVTIKNNNSLSSSRNVSPPPPEEPVQQDSQPVVSPDINTIKSFP